MTGKANPGLVDDALNALTYKVVGLAMAVHNDLGPGHRESTCHNAMAQRFVDAALAAESEPELPIFDEQRLFPPKQIAAHRRKRWTGSAEAA